MSIGLAALCNSALLLIGLRRSGVYKPLPGWPGFGWRVFVATALMGGGLAFAAHAIDWVGLGAQPAARIGLLALSLVAAAVVYFGALFVLGLPLRQLARRA